MSNNKRKQDDASLSDSEHDDKRPRLDDTGTLQHMISMCEDTREDKKATFEKLKAELDNERKTMNRLEADKEQFKASYNRSIEEVQELQEILQKAEHAQHKLDQANDEVEFYEGMLGATNDSLEIARTRYQLKRGIVKQLKKECEAYRTLVQLAEQQLHFVLVTKSFAHRLEKEGGEEEVISIEDWDFMNKFSSLLGQLIAEQQQAQEYDNNIEDAVDDEQPTDTRQISNELVQKVFILFYSNWTHVITTWQYCDTALESTNECS